MAMSTCRSPSSVVAEINSVRPKVSQDETEESWDSIAKGVVHLTLLCSQGACEFAPEVVDNIKPLGRPICRAINSERSRLSGPAIELVDALATGLGSSFEPLLHVFVPTLLNLFSRTNKVFTTRAKACMLVVIEHTQLPGILPYLVDALSRSKSPSPRLTATECVLACLNCFNPPDLEKDSRARLIEDVIRATARDASADVRKASKRVFEAYKALMPSRVDSFVAPLTPVIKKYLDVQDERSSNQGSTRNLRAAGKELIGRPQVPGDQVPTKSQSSTKPSQQQPKAVSERGIRVGKDTTANIIAKRPLPSRNNTSALAGPSRPAPVHLHNATSHSKAVQQLSDIEPVNRPFAMTSSTRSTSRQELKRPITAPRGPQRPDSAPKNLLRKQDDPQPRVGGGARRVPIQTPVLPDKCDGAESVERPISRNASTAAKVTAASNSRSSQPKKTAQSASHITEKSTSASGKASIKSSSTQKITTTKNLQSGTIKQAASAVPQVLQRGSTTTKCRGEEKNQPSKPVWGRAAGKVTVKPLAISGKSAGMRKLAPPNYANEDAESIAEAMIPLPLSPQQPPASNSSSPSPTDDEEQDATAENATNTLHAEVSVQQCGADDDHIDTPRGVAHFSDSPTKTPITNLLSSIQRGFLFTPSSPLSPPQSYLPIPLPNDGTEKNISDSGFNVCVRDIDPLPIFLLAEGDGKRHALGEVAVNQVIGS
ncbi:clasp N terminal-domain-containing protein [Hygrophoropsis aurantiaca]|uniref:Clasp N terminal-domain-containing protein n=1 Tax=Hygrophoropsis aurantiaca TaxID=72124 RepID=A0ACB8ALJ6_9AGAM|nr:clasp N terminal-domain-containing protein [Hygrophoropsis aurantiaca]